MRKVRLPARLREVFWDCDARSISWETDREFIMSRVLAAGDWESVRWLRAQVGDEALAAWLHGHRGRGLSSERLRYWEITLGLPHRTVTGWLRHPSRAVWDGRARR